MNFEETIKENLGAEDEKFPTGMRVLIIDNDSTSSKHLANLLEKCEYEVTTTTQAKVALEMLRENKKRFDIIITEVHMPDMDGFELLELVSREMDLPVIMVSENSDTKLVMKGVINGACDYLVKPVPLEELKNIWQHVIRKKMKEAKLQNEQQLLLQQEQQQQQQDDVANKDNETDNEKKPRVIWSVELHNKFMEAINQLGPTWATPKNIVAYMNDNRLTRVSVASHLQKYRMYQRRMGLLPYPS